MPVIDIYRRTTLLIGFNTEGATLYLPEEHQLQTIPWAKLQEELADDANFGKRTAEGRRELKQIHRGLLSLARAIREAAAIPHDTNPNEDFMDGLVVEFNVGFTPHQETKNDETH